MISHHLEREIQAFCTRIQRESPLFQNAAAGRLTPVHARRYVRSLHHLVAHTPVNLRLAIQESANRNAADLEQHFRKKFGEEQGHDEWADADTKNIDERFGLVDEVNDRSPWIDQVIAYNQRVIRDDPSLYVIYILLVEYATVLAGPALIELMQSRCGITPDMLSVVGNHVELDKQHVREGLEEIDRLLDPASLDASMASLRHAMGLLENFFSDVGTVH